MTKPLFLALAAAATLATPFAAQAAPYGNLNQREAQIQNQIDRGTRQGSISRSEARSLSAQLAQINSLENQYRRSDRRFTTRERADIDRRLDTLTRRVQQEQRDWNNRRDRGPGSRR